MAITNLLQQRATFTRRRPSGAEDAHGNPTTVDEDDELVACYYEQTQPSEITVGRSLEMADGLLVLPADTEAAANDEVVIDGITHAIIGPPWQVFDPVSGEVSHIECRTRSYVG